MNNWITFFTEIINLLNSCLVDTRYSEGSNAETDSLAKITEALPGMEGARERSGCLLIRSRGLGEKSISTGANSYEVVVRDIAVNTAVTPIKIKESGSRLSYLAEALSRVFDILYANNIANIYLRIPSHLPEDLDRLKISLRVLSAVVQALKTDAPVVFKRNGEQISIPLVKDERGNSHPNLTMVTALNNLDPEQTQALVKKVDSWLRDPDSETSGGRFVDVYDAMKSSPKFQKFMKPPVEINNFRWQIAGSETDTIPNERIQVVKKAAAVAQESPHKAAHILAGIYGNDFEKISARVLSERLIQITEFLNAIGEIKESLLKEIHENVLSRFTQVRRDVRDLLILKETTLCVSSRGNDIPVGKIDPEFVKMIQFFGSSPLPKDELAQRQIEPAGKGKKEDDPKNIQPERKTEEPVAESAIQRPTAKASTAADKSVAASSEMEKLVGDRIDQMEHGGQTHAQEAEEMEPPPIPVERATEARADSTPDMDQEPEDIVTHFKRCFDSKGHFQRGAFEKNIPALANHREQVFEFIWQYLKGTMNREDRLALLSSLHLLVNKINQSEKAVRVLLNDIFSEPNKVDISDRNGLMLASLVIRKYNKEFNQEMELTPEEVFLVKEGLIGSAVQAASKIIETRPKNVMQKQMTVYSGITRSLGLAKDDSASMPFRYLLNLEREACIFLSLVGGPTPRTILRDALNVYGNPDSEIYKSNGDTNHITAFFQHLKILVRGLGRIGEKEDIAILEALKNNEQGFMQFCQDAKSQDMILRILKWADDSVKHLEVNSDK